MSEPAVAPDEAEDRCVRRDQRDDQAGDEHGAGGRPARRARRRRRRARPDGPRAARRARRPGDRRARCARAAARPAARSASGGVRSAGGGWLAAPVRGRARRAGRRGRLGRCRRGLGRAADRLGVGDQEVLLARAAGRAEPRARADALAAVGAIPRLRPCHRRFLCRLACVCRKGWYHFETMDGGGAKLSRARGPLAVAAWVPALRRRRPPRRRARRPATPKILLAFDASGSMAADDGAGTPKIEAAQDAAVDLLGSLPPSTQVGLRVFGGTKPSRPIGPGVPRLEPRPADRPARPRPGRAADPLVQGEGPHPDRLRPGARRRGPRDLGAADDHPRLRRQGHLPAALAVPGRPAHRQGRRRDAHPGDRLQRRPGRRGASSKCIAQAGGGVYTDADNAADAEGAAARALHARAAPVRPEGQAGARRPERAAGRPRSSPGATSTRMLPDSERWYAVELRRGETLKASASFIPPRRDIADHAAARARQPRHRHAELRDPRPPELVVERLRLPAPRLRDGFGAVSRPIGVGAPGRLRPAVLPARALLPQARAQGHQREGPLRRHRRPALPGRARRRGARPPRRQPRRRRRARSPRPQRPDARRRRLAQRAAGDGPARPRRRRPGRRSASPARVALRAQEGVDERARRRRGPRRRGARAARAGPRPGRRGQAGRRRRLVQHRAAARPRRPTATPWPRARRSTGRCASPRARCCGSRRPSTRRRSRPTRWPTATTRAWRTSTYFLDIFSPLREQLSEESGGTYDTASARLEGSRRRGREDGHGDRAARAGLRADPGQRLQQGQVPGAGGVVRLAERRRHGHLPRGRPGRAARRARRAGPRPGAALVGGLRQGAARARRSSSPTPPDAGRGPVARCSPPPTSPPTPR